MATVNHYDTFGLARTATYADIRGKYLEMARKHHPDKNTDPSSNAKFQELNRAYTVLSNPVLRADHDRFLGYTDTSGHDGHNQMVLIKKNKYSLTLEITEGLAQVWVEVLREFYKDHEYNDRKENGKQVKAGYRPPDSEEVLDTISVTVYETTSRIHVQGSSYILWMEEHLPLLEAMVLERARKDEELAKVVQAKAARKSGRTLMRSMVNPIPPASVGKGGAHIHKCAACHADVDITSGAAWQCELCSHCFHIFCVSSDGGDTDCVLCTEGHTRMNQQQSTTPTSPPQPAGHMATSTAIQQTGAEPEQMGQHSTSPSTNAAQSGIDSPSSPEDGPTADTTAIKHLDDSATDNGDTAINGEAVSSPAGQHPGQKRSKPPAKKTGTKRWRHGRKERCTDQSLNDKVSILSISIGYLKRSLHKLEGKFTDLLDRMSETADKNDTPESTPEVPAKTCPPATAAIEAHEALAKKVTHLEKQVKELRQLVTHKAPTTRMAPENAGNKKPTGGAPREGNGPPNSSTEQPTEDTSSQDGDAITDGRRVEVTPEGVQEGDQATGQESEDESRGTSDASKEQNAMSDAGKDSEDTSVAGTSDGNDLPDNASEKTTNTNDKASKSQDKYRPRVDVLLVTSSIGSDIDSQRMYRKKKARVIRLREGKDMAAARNYMEKTNVQAKTVTFIVGSNDLARAKTVSSCMVELEGLVRYTRARMGPDTHILISQVLPRTGWATFNKKAPDFNIRTERYCKRTPNVHFVPHINLVAPENRTDSIHLSRPAVSKMVTNLKAVLNPLLGMKATSNTQRNTTAKPTEEPRSEWDNYHQRNRYRPHAPPQQLQQGNSRQNNGVRYHNTGGQHQSTDVHHGQHASGYQGYHGLHPATETHQTQATSAGAHYGHYAAQIQPPVSQPWQQQQGAHLYGDSAPGAATNHSNETMRGYPIPVVTSNSAGDNCRDAENVTTAPSKPRGSSIRAAIDTVLQLADILKNCEQGF